jgi:hypothetical protein
MRDLLDAAGGTSLGKAEYIADFDERFWRIDAAGFWKLERLQSFQEPGSPSWRAFSRGNWKEAIALIDSNRPEYQEYGNRMDAAGFGHFRVRVVDLPVGPYLQWELELLRVKSEYRQPVRVLPSDGVSAWETERPLPELVVLGSEAAYEVVYTAEGFLDGAVRYTDASTVAALRERIRALYRSGEELETFWAREVAGLPTPGLQPGG